MARHEVQLLGGPLDGYELNLERADLMPDGILKIAIPVQCDDGWGRREYAYAYDGQRGTSADWIYHAFVFKHEIE